MGATETVNAVEGVLTQKEKDELLLVLQKRQGELAEAILDVNQAIDKLVKAGAKPPPTA